MKNNIVRKALSLLLAGVMMASSASPAFAGEVSESEAGAASAAQETEKTAQEFKEPITLAGLYSEETKEPEVQPQGEEKKMEVKEKKQKRRMMGRRSILYFLIPTRVRPIPMTAPGQTGNCRPESIRCLSMRQEKV